MHEDEEDGWPDSRTLTETLHIDGKPLLKTWLFMEYFIQENKSKVK